ncbi:MAG: electron transfer flavoprotein subunit beta/FixA family protein [Bacteroidetes bacterium]|nr:electron transfer flavoprotein subunit beta/FixA family protein [Bacteroidota bacterium]
MNIAVCVKQTPDTESKPILSPDHRQISDEGIVWIINPHDESAIEVAIGLRDQLGGLVTLISVGPNQVESALRQGLAMGADEAIHLHCSEMPIDQKMIAEVLAEKTRSLGCELVLTGEVAIDGCGSQVPQRLGVLLDWPCVTGVEELSIDSGQFTARQPVEQGDKIHAGSLPSVIGINRRIMEPRYPSFKGIMKAKRKAIHKEEVLLNSADLLIESLMLTPKKSGGKVVEYQEGTAEEVVKYLQTHTTVF